MGFLIWVLVAVLAVAAAVGIGGVWLKAGGNGRAKARRALSRVAPVPLVEPVSVDGHEPVYVVPQACRSSGHAYLEYDTGWRCATCGNHVPRQEGEQYGLVSDGRHERRRRSR